MGYDWQIGDELTAARLNDTGTAGMLTLEAGENITANKAVWLQGQRITVLDETDVIGGTYVFNGSPGTNYYPNDFIRTGGAGGTYLGLVEYDLTGTPSSADTIACYFIPSYDNNSDSGAGTITNLTTSWDQTTVTYATRPTAGAINVVVGGTQNTGHKVFDITTIYNDAKDNTRYGFQFNTGGASGTHQFFSQTNVTTYDGISASHLYPYLVIIANDPNAGKVYTVTDLEDPNEMGGLIGFAAEAGTTGNPMLVQKAGVLDGFAGLTTGVKYYVDASGDLTTTVTQVQAGVAISTTELLIQRPQKQLIRQMKLGATVPGAGDIVLLEFPWLPNSDLAYLQMRTQSPTASYANHMASTWLSNYQDEFSSAQTSFYEQFLGGISDLDVEFQYIDTGIKRVRSRQFGTAGDGTAQGISLNFYNRNW